MAASGLQKIVTEVADSLGYCLKAEQKQAIPSPVEGKDVFVSLPTGHEVTIAYRTTKILRKIRPQLCTHYAIMTFLCHN